MNEQGSNNKIIHLRNIPSFGEANINNMKTYTRQPETKANVAQPKASRQASAYDVLQAYKSKIVQRQEIDEDELLQGKFNDTVQREEFEEDELLQGKFDTAQREEIDEDELLQGKFDVSSTVQREEATQPSTENLTGMPDNLKSGIESLSGYSMDDVQVHYNSAKPAQLQAFAYAQGSDIHIAPGQEKHLPHEAWHVVQQKQGRVQPTMQLQGVNVNDNEGLEKEADVMGRKAMQRRTTDNHDFKVINRKSKLIQREVIIDEYKVSTPTLVGQSWQNIGALIKIRYKHNSLDGFDDGDKIYLIQSVKDTIKKIPYNCNRANPEKSHRTLNQTAGFDKRLTDELWAIDHSIYKEDVGKKVIGNLDPRYAEFRLTPSEIEDKTSKYNKEAIFDGREWSYAGFGDEPTTKCLDSSKLEGSQKFEIVPYLDRGGNLRLIENHSIKWGLTINQQFDEVTKKANQPKITLDKIQAEQIVSSSFKDASKKWNTMELIIKRDEAKELLRSREVPEPIILPTKKNLQKTINEITFKYYDENSVQIILDEKFKFPD